jgi:hypothetical protein
MTKKEWMAYIEKTWDAAQKEAWSEPQFECPRCGHCCKSDLARVGEVGVWGEWQGLTDEEVSEAIDDVLEGGGWLDVSRAIEAKLKEKNHG